MKLFLQRNAKLSSALLPNPQAPVPPAARGFAPKPPAAPDSHWPPEAGSSAPRPPKEPPPIVNFWLHPWTVVLLALFTLGLKGKLGLP